MIDTSEWKEFQFDSVFDVRRGDRIVKDADFIAEKTDGYIYPVITAKTTNNGVDGYYFDYNCDGNCLVACGEASGMFTTYQAEKCWCMDTVRIITLKEDRVFDTNIALFLATILTQEMYRFSYGRKAKPGNMNSLVLKLPATPSGEPDWQYMEDFIGGRHCKPITTSIKSSHLSLKTERWGEFLLSDLFEIRMGNGFDKNKMTDDSPTVNFVSRVSYNNGVDCKVDTVEGTAPFPSGMITVALGGSYLGSSFVQNEPFYTGQNVAVMLPRYDIGLLEKIFICGLIRMESAYKYQAFGRELNSHIRKDFTIQLPVIDDGTPNWQWMEEYMKSLPYSDRIPNSHE